MKNQGLYITQEDFQKIMADEWELFQEEILHKCLCHTCNSSYNSTIIDYRIELNDLNDIILHGKCATCGSPMNRYLETGKDEKKVQIIEEIKRRYAKN